MNYELDNYLPETDVTKVVKNLEKGNTVELTTEEGTFEGVVMTLTDKILVVTMLQPLTSAKAHAHHWEVGDYKSIQFKKIQKIKNLTPKNP